VIHKSYERAKPLKDGDAKLQGLRWKNPNSQPAADTTSGDLWERGGIKMNPDEEAKHIVKEWLMNDIALLKELLVLTNQHVNSLTHPLMIKISEILDQKLNQYQRLTQKE
jgi:hypothetical protein